MKNANILLIDDDETMNFLNKIIIERAQLNVEVADFTDATAALQELQEGRLSPELILLDLNMPIMDGWQFLDKFAELQAVTSKASVVILSSSINPVDLRRAEENNCVKAFYSKPLSVERIKEISEVVSNKN